MLFKLLANAPMKTQQTKAPLFEEYNRQFPNSIAALEGLINAHQQNKDSYRAKLAAKSLVALINSTKLEEAERSRLLTITDGILKGQ
jgi:hypothetical protein